MEKKDLRYKTEASRRGISEIEGFFGECILDGKHFLFNDIAVLSLDADDCCVYVIEYDFSNFYHYIDDLGWFRNDVSDFDFFERNYKILAKYTFDFEEERCIFCGDFKYLDVMRSDWEDFSAPLVINDKYEYFDI